MDAEVLMLRNYYVFLSYYVTYVTVMCLIGPNALQTLKIDPNF